MRENVIPFSPSPFPSAYRCFIKFNMAKAPVKCLSSSRDAFILPVHSFVDNLTANDNLAPVKFLLGGRAECGITPEVGKVKIWLL